jgi:outer membrane protein
MQVIKNIIFVTFFFISSHINVLANDKVAFIDINYLVENSYLGKKITEGLNTTNTNNVKKINSQEKKLIDQENEIKKVQNILSEEELKIKVTALRKNIKTFNQKKKDISKEFNDIRNAKLKEFFDKINPLFLEYMNKESIIIIVEKKNIFIGKSTHDITMEMLKIINKKFD